MKLDMPIVMGDKDASGVNGRRGRDPQRPVATRAEAVERDGVLGAAENCFQKDLRVEGERSRMKTALHRTSHLSRDANVLPRLPSPTLNLPPRSPLQSPAHSSAHLNRTFGLAIYGPDHVPQDGRGLAHELPTEAPGHRVVKATRKRRRAPPRTPPGPAGLWKLPEGSNLGAGTEREPRRRVESSPGWRGRGQGLPRTGRTGLRASGHWPVTEGSDSYVYLQTSKRLVLALCTDQASVLGLHQLALTLILGGARSQGPKRLGDKSGAGSRYAPTSLPEARTPSSPGLTRTGPGRPPLLPTSNHSAPVVGLSAPHTQRGGFGSPCPSCGL